MRLIRNAEGQQHRDLMIRGENFYGRSPYMHQFYSINQEPIHRSQMLLIDASCSVVSNLFDHDLQPCHSVILSLISL